MDHTTLDDILVLIILDGYRLQYRSRVQVDILVRGKSPWLMSRLKWVVIQFLL